MPVRFAFTVNTAQNESFVGDACQWNPVTGEVMHTIEQMKELAEEMLSIADKRIADMNMRVIEAAGIKEYCTPEEWSKMVSVFDIITGKQTADQVGRRLQSAAEETQALEQGRADAVSGQNTKMCIDCGVIYKSDFDNFSYAETICDKCMNLTGKNND